jgi:hypothetical protein
VLGQLSAAYLENGQIKEAAEMKFRQLAAEGTPQLSKAAERAFAESGFRGIFAIELASLKGKDVSPVDLARLHARLGHREEAIRLLQKAVAQRASLLIFRLNEPDFDPLRSDPRFRAVAQKVGLPYAPPGTKS